MVQTCRGGFWLWPSYDTFSHHVILHQFPHFAHCHLFNLPSFLHKWLPRVSCATQPLWLMGQVKTAFLLRIVRLTFLQHCISRLAFLRHRGCRLPFLHRSSCRLSTMRQKVQNPILCHDNSGSASCAVTYFFCSSSSCCIVTIRPCLLYYWGAGARRRQSPVNVTG